MRLTSLLAAAVSASAQWTYTENDDLSAAIVVNAFVKYQEMIGGGCSGAFGIACQQVGNTSLLSPANQQAVTQILFFDENIGGLSLLRNDIGSNSSSANHDGSRFTILPTCPATPGGPFNYVRDGDDTCQLQLTQTALQYNPELFVYADAWSAPGCMKTVGEDANGGFICGVRGSNCSADWHQAYADYLVQYVRFYQQEGINISMLGAYNEPDFNPVTYASMLSDGFQAKDFLEVLYPTAKAAFPDLKVACCDATGTWHNYQSEPKQPFNTAGQPNLMTEWADGSGGWNANWDITGQLAEGFQWALYMHNAFTRSDTSGYTHWWCAGNAGDNTLILLQNNTYQTSARLWTFASYFRFARPGSVRVDASSSVEEVYVSAFVNKNGTVAVPVINAAHAPYEVNVDLFGVNVTRATAYLTDNAHNVSMVEQFAVTGSSFRAMVEPRAMKTFYLDIGACG